MVEKPATMITVSVSMGRIVAFSVPKIPTMVVVAHASTRRTTDRAIAYTGKGVPDTRIDTYAGLSTFPDRLRPERISGVQLSLVLGCVFGVVNPYTTVYM